MILRARYSFITIEESIRWPTRQQHHTRTRTRFVLCVRAFNQGYRRMNSFPYSTHTHTVLPCVGMFPIRRHPANRDKKISQLFLPFSWRPIKVRARSVAAAAVACNGISMIFNSSIGLCIFIFHMDIGYMMQARAFTHPLPWHQQRATPIKKVIVNVIELECETSARRSVGRTHTHTQHYPSLSHSSSAIAYYSAHSFIVPPLDLRAKHHIHARTATRVCVRARFFPFIECNCIYG